MASNSGFVMFGSSRRNSDDQSSFGHHVEVCELFCKNRWVSQWQDNYRYSNFKFLSPACE